MKKRLLISVALALVLTVLGSAPVLAAKPESTVASGIITYISAGTVFPAGESGRWVVAEREIEGVFDDSDISGTFTMTYKANVELETQAGNLHGTLEVGSYVLKVNGRIEPLEFVAEGPYEGLPKITITGHWTVIEGAQGHGDFSAQAIFMPDPDGHVEIFIASDFTLTGKWK